MERLIQDVRYSFRILLKSPAVAVMIIVTLGLGIGANSAVFSVVNAVLLQPLPYKDTDRLVTIWATYPQLETTFSRVPVSTSDFVEWRNQSTVFESISALDSFNLTLTGMGEPQRITAARVSASFFDLMGVKPVAGRIFTLDEDRPGNDNVVVISDALWRTRFGSDPNAIGKTLTFSDKSYTIIGIMPAAFQFPRASEMPAYFGFPQQAEMWLPIAISEKRISNRRYHDLAVIARLKQGVTIQQAQTELGTIAANLEQVYPENKGWGVAVMSLRKHLVGDVQLALLVLLGAVSFVLLISCVNVANLLLARSVMRQREMAIRAALGADRSRIIRQLITESLLLALLGGILGIILASLGIKLFFASSNTNLPRVEEVALDGWVLGFTLVVSMITGVLFGIIPAFYASKLNLSRYLKEGSHTAAGTVHHNRIRNLLVVSEIALALVLLVGAGLLINSFTLLLKVSPGFDPDGVLVMDISLPESKYPEKQQQTTFYRNLLERVSALPAVESTGIVLHLPLRGAAALNEFVIDGRPLQPDEKKPVTEIRMTSPNYFASMGIPVLSGRGLTEHDNPDGLQVAVINQAMAKRFWPDQDPIGNRVKLGGQDQQFSWESIWLTIVGVAGDVKDTLDSETGPQIYLSYQQHIYPLMSLVVRTSTDPLNLVPVVRREIQAIDKDQPVINVKTMRQYLSESVALRRFHMLLLGIFAAVALTLAAIGVYGLIAYSVTQRKREIGIRMALGARKADIVKMVLGKSLILILIGIAIGLAVSLAMTRVMSSMLYGVSATDLTTFTFVSLLLIGIATLASFIPASRAAKVDPVIALKYE
jgi:putative ABC transport system permease protein